MPKKILVIDDNIAHTRELSFHLQQHSYRIRTHHDSEDVFQQISSEQPDLVLLDNQFSRFIDIIDYLKLKTLPFLLLSDIPDHDYIAQITGHGALGFWLKPINAQQLIIEIETALHRHREKMQLNRRKENIDETITNNRKISMAIGIVMERYKIKDAEAFEILRITARNKQHRVTDIAKKIVTIHERSLPDVEIQSLQQESPKQHEHYLGLIQSEIQGLVD